MAKKRKHLTKKQRDFQYEIDHLNLLRDKTTRSLKLVLPNSRRINKTAISRIQEELRKLPASHPISRYIGGFGGEANEQRSTGLEIKVPNKIYSRKFYEAIETHKIDNVTRALKFFGRLGLHQPHEVSPYHIYALAGLYKEYPQPLVNAALAYATSAPGGKERMRKEITNEAVAHRVFGTMNDTPRLRKRVTRGYSLHEDVWEHPLGSIGRHLIAIPLAAELYPFEERYESVFESLRESGIEERKKKSGRGRAHELLLGEIYERIDELKGKIRSLNGPDKHQVNIQTPRGAARAMEIRVQKMEKRRQKAERKQNQTKKRQPKKGAGSRSSPHPVRRRRTGKRG